MRLSLSMNKLSSFLAMGALVCFVSPYSHAAEEAPSVKGYLLKTLSKMKGASEDFVKSSGDYADLVKASGGNVEAAYKADSNKVDALIEKMRADYKTMDSYGYETIEGIVAGVPSLSDYDIYLDAGVPASEGPDNVAPVVLDLGNGEKISKQGCLFTYIIEPTLWAGNKKYVVKLSNGKELPRPEVLAAAAADVNKKIGELQKDAEAWNASTADCFGAMVTMTPTLSDYFEDWRESRYSKDKSGKFQAVSRISDMRGIMGSCSVMYDAVKENVAQKDKALAKSVHTGFDQILKFIDQIDKRERQGEIKPAEIDELATQAKEKTDKLVPQIQQSAAVVGVKVASS